MKFDLVVSGKSMVVEKLATDQEAGPFQVDGVSCEVSSECLEPGLYSLLVDGASYEVAVREEKKGFVVELESHVIPVKLLDPFHSQSSGADAIQGEAVLASPMPGRVVSLKVVVGQEVKQGEGVVVVEAMKMENELHSPKEGKVKKIDVKVGDTVESGQDLVTIE